MTAEDVKVDTMLELEIMYYCARERELFSTFEGRLDSGLYDENYLSSGTTRDEGWLKMFNKIYGPSVVLEKAKKSKSDPSKPHVFEIYRRLPPFESFRIDLQDPNVRNEIAQLAYMNPHFCLRFQDLLEYFVEKSKGRTESRFSKTILDPVDPALKQEILLKRKRERDTLGFVIPQSDELERYMRRDCKLSGLDWDNIPVSAPASGCAQAILLSIIYGEAAALSLYILWVA